MARRRLTPAAPQFATAFAAELSRKCSARGTFARDSAGPAAFPRFSPAAPIARVAAEAAGAAALEEMADTLRRARDEGRLVLDLALDAIAPDHLARDRLPAEDAEMAALRDSIRAHGQRTPIEVTPLVASDRAPRAAPCPMG